MKNYIFISAIIWLCAGVPACGSGGTPEDRTDTRPGGDLGRPWETVGQDSVDSTEGEDLSRAWAPAFAPAGPDQTPDPSTTGPFPVGVVTVEVLDQARVDPINQGPRRLRTEIWYPALPDTGDEPAAYDLVEQAQDYGLEIPDPRGQAPTFPSAARRGATGARAWGPYPVIVFSHGAYSARFQYSFILEHLASHGYVVVAPDHRGNTLWDMLSAGFDTTAMIQSGFDRPGDLSLVLNQVEILSAEPNQPLEGLPDLGRVAALGHSLGGSTAIAIPCVDPRFSLTALMTPVIAMARSFGLENTNYPVPALCMGGDQDLTVSWQSQWCEFRKLERQDKRLYQLKGAGHFTFSDMCLVDWESLTGPPVEGAPDVAEDGCSDRNIPLDEGQERIRGVLTAWFNLHLRESSGALEYLDQVDGATLTLYSDPIPDHADGCGD